MTENKDLLASVSEISTESEFFSPIPKNYKKGKTRYVIVMGTVMSGLGKGIFSSCLAKLMQDKGIKVHEAKTRDAVAEFTELQKEYARIVAALHLTC